MIDDCKVLIISDVTDITLGVDTSSSNTSDVVVYHTKTNKWFTRGLVTVEGNTFSGNFERIKS